MKAVFLLLVVLVVHAHAQRWTFPEEPNRSPKRPSINAVHPTDAVSKKVEDSANEFALALYKATLSDEKGNFISSPFSTYMVLAMALFGARGQTFQELQNVLHLSARTMKEFRNMQKNLQEITHKLEKHESVVLKVGNKIFIRSDVSLNPSYQSVVETTFSSSIQKVNFNYVYSAARRINAWISKFTENKIKRIIDPAELSSDISLLLVNTIYFKGAWEIPFDNVATYPRPFYVNGGIPKDVPTMYQNGKYRSAILDDLDAIAVVLPYQNNGMRQNGMYMYLIRPNQINGLAKVEAKIESLSLEALRNTTERTIELMVPKFRIETQLNLKYPLKQLGVENAFSRRANFATMTGSGRSLRINQVVQNAFIEIDEDGTEAAVATGGYLGDRLLGGSFYIDRPFLIIIATDDIILFTGKVVDPTL